jgi:pimeloyl-ACP methyl ester carboxylesterase
VTSTRRSGRCGRSSRSPRRSATGDFPRPVLIAWGDDDRLFPRSLAVRLAQDLPHSRLVTLTDCAAFAALDQPEQLASCIDEHLRESAVALA